MVIFSIWEVVLQKKIVLKSPTILSVTAINMRCNHVYIERKYKGGSAVCSHPPKCIVYSGLYRADCNYCLLNLRNFKLIKSIKSSEDLNVFQI